MVDLDTLRRFPFFAELIEQNLKEVALITRQKTVPAGTRMFGEGDDANALYLIVKGKVEIQYTVGEETFLSIQTLSDGDLLVWSSLIAPYKTQAMGTTTVDTMVLEIDAQKLREFFDTDPALGHLLMHQVAKMLGQRLQNARGKFATLYGSLDHVLRGSKD
jgi:CRP-like cAMP-binding protein